MEYLPKLLDMSNYLGNDIVLKAIDVPKNCEYGKRVLPNTTDNYILTGQFPELFILTNDVTDESTVRKN